MYARNMRRSYWLPPLRMSVMRVWYVRFLYTEPHEKPLSDCRMWQKKPDLPAPADPCWYVCRIPVGRQKNAGALFHIHYGTIPLSGPNSPCRICCCPHNDMVCLSICGLLWLCLCHEPHVSFFVLLYGRPFSGFGLELFLYVVWAFLVLMYVAGCLSCGG